jgi:hypothetical protein
MITYVLAWLVRSDLDQEVSPGGPLDRQWDLRGALPRIGPQADDLDSRWQPDAMAKRRGRDPLDWTAPDPRLMDVQGRRV